jgi:hypothetical protein
VRNLVPGDAVSRVLSQLVVIALSVEVCFWVPGNELSRMLSCSVALGVSISLVCVSGRSLVSLSLPIDRCSSESGRAFD